MMSRTEVGCHILALALALAPFMRPGDGWAATQDFPTTTAATVSEQEAHDIAVDAYIYLYPLVLMDITRRQLTNIQPGRNSRAPSNSFSSTQAYPVAGFNAGGRPNFDTLYSTAWLDLTRGPLIMSVPDTKGRYYALPMLDMWTDVFASPGKRTTGTRAGDFALVPSGWHGRLPSGVTRINVPTSFVWILGRTQTNGPADYSAVQKIQEGVKLTPIAWWQGRTLSLPRGKVDPALDMKTPPIEQVNRMPASIYFSYAAELMRVNPPHVTDWSIVANMKRIGLEAGKRFDLEKLDPAIRQAVTGATTEGLKRMYAKAPSLGRLAHGWQMDTQPMGVYGNDYLKRAVVAMLNLGANQPEDVIAPVNVADVDGKPLIGDNRYILHFDKSTLPPTLAFWSVTLYDQAGLPVANALNRFAVSSWMPFNYNRDGSLDLYFQADNPGHDHEANWLPTPKGPFNLMMRLYAPKSPALTGEWNPPPVMNAAARPSGSSELR